MQDNCVCSCTAFDGDRLIASGPLVAVVRSAKEAVDRKGASPVLIFDDRTSEVIDVDYRGTVEDVVNRLVAVRVDPNWASSPRRSRCFRNTGNGSRPSLAEHLQRCDVWCTTRRSAILRGTPPVVRPELPTASCRSWRGIVRDMRKRRGRCLPVIVSASFR